MPKPIQRLISVAPVILTRMPPISSVMTILVSHGVRCRQRDNKTRPRVASPKDKSTSALKFLLSPPNGSNGVDLTRPEPPSRGTRKSSKPSRSHLSGATEAYYSVLPVELDRQRQKTSHQDSRHNKVQPGTGRSTKDTRQPNSTHPAYLHQLVQ